MCEIPFKISQQDILQITPGDFILALTFDTAVHVKYCDNIWDLSDSTQ